MNHTAKRNFDHLSAQLTTAWWYWKVYCQLFFDNQDRRQLIRNTVEPIFLQYHHSVLLHVTLILARFGDRSETFGQANLSFKNLIDQLDVSESEIIQNQEDFAETLTSLTDIRNKVIAHSDLRRILDVHSFLPSKLSVEKALVSAGQFMNSIEKNFMNSTTAYEAIVLPLTGDGRALLILLQKALAYDKLEELGKVNRGYWRDFGSEN